MKSYDLETDLIGNRRDGRRIVFRGEDSTISADPDDVLALCGECDGMVSFTGDPTCPDCGAEFVCL